MLYYKRQEGTPLKGNIMAAYNIISDVIANDRNAFEMFNDALAIAVARDNTNDYESALELHRAYQNAASEFQTFIISSWGSFIEVFGDTFEDIHSAIVKIFEEAIKR